MVSGSAECMKRLTEENSCICATFGAFHASWKDIGKKNMELQESIGILREEIEELKKIRALMQENGSTNGKLPMRNGLKIPKVEEEIKDHLGENENPPLNANPSLLSVLSSSSSFDDKDNNSPPVGDEGTGSKKVTSWKYFLHLS